MHTLTDSLQQKLSSRRTLNILLVGAGGNGSKMLMGLRSLHNALTAFGFGGLHVTLADGDTVSESNLARQNFYPSDLGQNKAFVLINRLNITCALTWTALPRHATSIDTNNADFVITCVDTRAARATINLGVTGHARVAYWLDLGNTDTTGQVILGQPDNALNNALANRLPTCTELFPEISDTSIPEDEAPTCSTVEALARQDLFINDMLVVQGLNLIWQLLRHQQISSHGAFVNTITGLATPIPTPNPSQEENPTLP